MFFQDMLDQWQLGPDDDSIEFAYLISIDDTVENAKRHFDAGKNIVIISPADPQMHIDARTYTDK